MSLQQLLEHHYELGRFVEQERWANQEHDRSKELFWLLFMIGSLGLVMGVVIGAML